MQLDHLGGLEVRRRERGEVLSLDDLVAEVTRVEAADITRVVDRVLGVPERTLAVVGPVDAATFGRDRQARGETGDAVGDVTL